MVKSVELNNPKIVEMPDFREFMAEVLPEDPKALLAPGGFASVEDWVRGIIASPETHVSVTVEKGRFVGFVLIIFPDNPAVSPYPIVSHIFNRGTLASREALIQAVLDAMVRGGYTKFVALNASKLADARWKKAFASAGSITKAATMFEFEIGS